MPTTIILATYAASRLLFSRILVAVDGSESAKRAFEKSVYLAKECNSRLDIIHVVLDSTYGGESAAGLPPIEEDKKTGNKEVDENALHGSMGGVKQRKIH